MARSLYAAVLPSSFSSEERCLSCASCTRLMILCAIPKYVFPLKYICAMAELELTDNGFVTQLLVGKAWIGWDEVIVHMSPANENGEL